VTAAASVTVMLTTTLTSWFRVMAVGSLSTRAAMASQKCQEWTTCGCAGEQIPTCGCARLLAVHLMTVLKCNILCVTDLKGRSRWCMFTHVVRESKQLLSMRHTIAMHVLLVYHQQSDCRDGVKLKPPGSQYSLATEPQQCCTRLSCTSVLLCMTSSSTGSAAAAAGSRTLL